MKIIELTNKILLPITNEENDLLRKFNDDMVLKRSLTEREQVLANQLTIKNILTRTNKNGQIYYKKRL